MAAAIRSKDSAKLPALITGASGGIGADLARVFAGNGHAVILVARNREKLDALAQDIRRQHKVETVVIAADLEQDDAIADLAAKLRAENLVPGILVNNAGFGLNGTFADLDGAEQLRLINLNIQALTALTHRFLPEIVEARGAILNVASVASFFPGPGMAVYYASKAYVLSLSEALAYELKGQGVRVSALCPGPTATGFAHRAGIPPETESFYSMASMPVAEAGYRGLMAGRRVIVPGAMNRLLRLVSLIIPNRLSMAGVARMQMKRTQGRLGKDGT